MFRYLTITLAICLISGSPLAAQEKIRVACVGDSITEGTYKNVYPDKLSDLLGNRYEVKNFGVGAATLLAAGAKPYRNQPVFTEAIKFKPNVVVILLGTNDSKMEDWMHSDDFVDDYSKLIAAFEMLPTKPTIYVCTPPTVVEDHWGIRGKIVEKEVRAKVVETGKKKGVEVIDVFDAFAGKDDLHSDGVHPNDEGASLIADTVHGAMTKKANK